MWGHGTAAKYLTKIYTSGLAEKMGKFSQPIIFDTIMKHRFSDHVSLTSMLLMH